MESLQIGLGSLALMMLLALLVSFVGAWQEADATIGSVISTGALRPGHAVAWAAVLNGLGGLLFAPAITALVATGLLSPGLTDPATLIAGLATALCFAVLASRTHLPLDSLHVALGGLAGATLVQQDLSPMNLPGLLMVLAAIALAPLAAFAIGGCFSLLLAHLLRRSAPRSTDRLFRRAQWLSCGLFNLQRGNQHAQFALGLIWLSLMIAGLSDVDRSGPPIAFTLIIALAVAAGTLAGGHALLRRRGLRLARLRPVHACCSEAAAATTLAFASSWGLPVASRPPMTAAMAGSAQTGRMSLQRWGLDAPVIAAAVAAIPASAVLGAVFGKLFRLVI
jgi:PiT family inorganic phosphate transporter